MADSSVIPQQVDEHFELGAETSPIEALIVMSRALASLEPGDAQDRAVEVPASKVEQIILMLVDYRRLLEGEATQISALPNAQRAGALDAYQDLCQRVFGALSLFDCLQKGSQ